MTMAGLAPEIPINATRAAGARGRRSFWRADPEAKRGLTLIAPPFVYAALLLAAPILAAVVVSFQTQVGIETRYDWTLERYREAWTEEIYRVLMLRSLAVSASVTLATILFAYPIAYFVAFHVQRRRGLWLFLITLPFWTSYLLRLFVWKAILGFNGVVNGSLLWLGVIEAPLAWINNSVGAVILTLSHAWAPFAILPIFVALQKIDRSLLEAATDLGDGPWRRWLRVTLPLSMPGVMAAAVVVFIPTVGDYITPLLVGGNDGRLIANIIEVQFKKANNPPLGAALALSAMLITFALVALVAALWRLYRRGSPA